MSAPTNNLGCTEVEWNDWIERTAEWEAAHPVRAHRPHEVCDCTGIPVHARASGRLGHCAAVGPPVPWTQTPGAR